MTTLKERSDNRLKNDFTLAELEALTPVELAALIESINRETGATHGAGVVKNPGGKVKYDADAIPGQYGETAVELKDFPPGRLPT